MNRRTLALTMCLISAGLCGPAWAGTIHVPADQPSIQAGIQVARNGDEVVVAVGVYNEVIAFRGKAITVRSTDPNDPDIVASTIIDGRRLGSVVRCVDGEGPDTVLSGFTIRNGTGSQSPIGIMGGGLYGGSPTVMNCTFTGNSAFWGGAIGGGRPTVIGCLITGNQATYGGGLFANVASPTVTDCTFRENEATYGGGMANNANSPIVTGCIFDGNTATQGGGMWNNDGATPTVTDCTFTGNTADRGGGLWNHNSTPTITGCTFSDNAAANEGGGIHNRQGHPTLSDCTFSGNTAPHGAGMRNAVYSSATLTGCDFSGNAAAEYGGGMYTSEFGVLTVIDCTFTANSARDGGGMASSESFPTVTNCTFSANSGAGMYNFNGSAPTVSDSSFSDNVGSGMVNDTVTLSVSTSSFSGNTGESGGGMANVSSTVTVTDCAFNENQANGGGGMGNGLSTVAVTGSTFSGNTARHGGGMLNSGSAVTVTDCVFNENRAEEAEVGPSQGGGINHARYSGDGTLEVTGSTFTGNIADAGGGIYSGPGSTITGCLFDGNAAVRELPITGNGGGVYIDGKNAHVVDCSFTGNTAYHFGGGMYLVSEVSMRISGCDFDQNSARWGGGMSLHGGWQFGVGRVDHCTFTRNSAFEGGGLFDTNTTTTLVNCAFTGNTADQGGAVAAEEGKSRLFNCTLTGNRARQSEGGGAFFGYFARDVRVKMVNCILWNNLPGEFGSFFSTRPQVTYSAVTGGWTGEGNIGANPLFVDADGPDNIYGTADDNLRLSPGSPCIDAANNAAVPAGVTTDLDGQARFVDDPDTPDTGNGTAPIVDMGAYEYFPIGGDPRAPVTVRWAERGERREIEPWVIRFLTEPDATVPDSVMTPGAETIEAADTAGR